METFHNRNLYIYCDSNPVDRKDPSGELWGLAIASFIVGSVVSIGSQMIIEEKAFEDINWAEVGVSGLTTSMMMMGAPGWIQFAVGTIWDSVEKIAKGANPYAAVGCAVLNNAVSEVLPFKVDSGYSKIVRNYHKKVSKIAEKTLDPVEMAIKVADATKTYRQLMGTTTAQGTITYIQNSIVPKAKVKKYIGWGRRYNPKTGEKVLYRRYVYV